MAKTCRKLLNSKKTQRILKNAWKKYMDYQIKYNGGLEVNAWKTYKKDFDKGFMKGCQISK